MSDAVIMNNGTVLLNVHTEDVCQGQPCCIHNPSGHHMADWPPRWHNYSKQMWRTCPHGFVHPDPDDAWFIRRRYSEQEIIIRFSHGCDGCCLPPTPPTERKAIS